MPIDRRSLLCTALALASLLPACGGMQSDAVQPRAVVQLVPVEVSRSGLALGSACDGRFVPHSLGVTSGARMREIRTYASNGSGLASGDLDGDLDLDLVLASIDRESTILWNDGGLAFRPEPIADSFTRAANIVDVDGDGRLDIAFTHNSLESV
jgi:hypothetical protein